jgi:hypothetical protein
MKTLTLLLVSILLLSGGAAFAQNTGGGSLNNEVSRPASSKNELVTHDVTGFTNPYTGPGVTKESIDRPPNLHPNLKPQPGGIVTDTVKYGPELYSPFAPASLGNGERYLSAPDPRYDVDHEAGPAAHREAGGLKVFSLEF